MLEQSDHMTERPWLRMEMLKQYSDDLHLTLNSKELDYFSTYMHQDLTTYQTPGASGNMTLTSAGASEPLSESAIQKTPASVAQDFASAASCEPETARPNLVEVPATSSSILHADSAASAAAERWTSTWLGLQSRQRRTMAANLDMTSPEHSPRHHSREATASTATTTAATSFGTANTSAAAVTSSTTSASGDLHMTPHLAEDSAYQRFTSARRVTGSTAKSLELPAFTREDVASMTTTLGYESLPGRAGRGQHQSRDSGYSLSPLSRDASPGLAAQPAFQSWSALDATDDLAESAACAASTGEYTLFPPDKTFGPIGSERKRQLALPTAPDGASASPAPDNFTYTSTLNCDLNLPDEGFATFSPSRSNLLNYRKSTVDLLESLDSQSSSVLPATSTSASASRQSHGIGAFGSGKSWEPASDHWPSPAQDGSVSDWTQRQRNSASNAFQHMVPLADPGSFTADQVRGSLGRERSGSAVNVSQASAAAIERNASFAGAFSASGLSPSTTSAMLNSTWTVPPVRSGSTPLGNLESLSPGPFLPSRPPVSLAHLAHPMGPAVSCAPRAIFPGGPFLQDASRRLLVRGASARRHGVSEFSMSPAEATSPVASVPLRLVSHPIQMPVQMPILPPHAFPGLPFAARVPHPFAVGSVFVPPRGPNSFPVFIADPWSLNGCGPLDVSARLPSFHELNSFASGLAADSSRGFFGRGARFPTDPSRPNFSRRSHGDVFASTMDIVNRRLNQHVCVRRNVEINFTFQMRGVEEGLAPRFRLLPVQWQMNMVGLREKVTFKVYAIAEPQRQKSRPRTSSATSNSLSELCHDDSTDSRTNSSVFAAPLLGSVSENGNLNASATTSTTTTSSCFVSRGESGFLTGDSSAVPQDADALPSLQSLHRVGRLKVDIIAPSGRTFEPKVRTDSGTEAYFSYEFENFGQYIIRATVDGENVKGSEWVMHCQEAKDYSNLLDEEGKYVEVLSLRALPKDIKLHGVAYHPRQGLLLPDRSHAHVHRFDVEDALGRPAYKGVVLHGDPEGLDPHSVVQPSDVAVSPDNVLFVCDKKGNRVQVYSQGDSFLASYIGLETSWGVACSASNKMAVATFSKNDGELHVLDCDAQKRNILKLTANNPRKPFFLPDGRLALLDFEKTRLVLANDNDTTGLPLSMVCDFGVKGKPVGATIDAFGNIIVSTGRTCRLEFIRCISDGLREEWVNFLSLDFKPRLPRGTSFGGVAVIPGGRLVVVLESHEHEVEHRLLLLNPPAERKYKR